jgi:hypothetical protein
MLKTVSTPRFAHDLLVEYGGGLERKRWLLKHEGVEIQQRPKHRLSFRDAPLGAGPESILTIVVMDSGLALTHAPE